MRRNTSFIKNRIFLNEAPTDMEDFSLNQNDLGEQNQGPSNDDSSLNPIGNNTNNDNMGMDQQQDMGMQDGEMQGGGNMGMDDPMTNQFADPEIPEESELDRLKKLTLFKQYKELIELVSETKFTLEFIKKLPDFKEHEDIMYIEDRLDELDEKISITIETRYLQEKYTELLRMFYYFKYTIVVLTNMLAKLTGSEIKK